MDGFLGRAEMQGEDRTTERQAIHPRCSITHSWFNILTQTDERRITLHAPATTTMMILCREKTDTHKQL